MGYYEKGSSVVYTCIRCGESMTEDDLVARGGQMKCVSCGYKILKKTKPPIVKKVKAI